ncbi:hypothetical protein [Streptomyces sioyaensis]|uniref:hypothetical protein n=1 Tax=Streptomyces sioyaensis TaxID=67364 RepID=UPI003D71611D
MSDQQSEAREAVRQAKSAYDQGRLAFFDAIKKALAVGVGPSDLSRDSGFTREYIAKIRDGKGPKGI